LDVFAAIGGTSRDITRSNSAIVGVSVGVGVSISISGGSLREVFAQDIASSARIFDLIPAVSNAINAVLFALNSSTLDSVGGARASTDISRGGSIVILAALLLGISGGSLRRRDLSEVTSRDIVTNIFDLSPSRGSDGRDAKDFAISINILNTVTSARARTGIQFASSNLVVGAAQSGADEESEENEELSH